MTGCQLGKSRRGRLKSKTPTDMGRGEGKKSRTRERIEGRVRGPSERLAVFVCFVFVCFPEPQEHSIALNRVCR